ncbi:hypothetical protein VVD49_00665 [Uliginosibacterium sp. H3]|uniref:Class I SAM-dependent methyltransferase n=1 Tax=Uliginosibacterium silvisoli TaxID=3114758 RepID=A0ABU6JZE3_9RHOO|nr:hypothetical protein [Uliginosibacterium sp. H3]
MPANADTTPRLQQHWLHNSGGLIWHLRALRYRTGLWQDFRRTTRDWLQAWQPPATRLLLVGPSAGHTLDEEFLQRWQAVTVLEPDPLARHLLRWRYPQVRWHFDDVDILAQPGTGLLAQHFGEHAVLFANVLGQLAPREEGTAREWLRALRGDLARQHWASYHDVISTTRKPDHSVTGPVGGTDLDALIAHFWRGGELPIVDHGTLGLGQPGAETASYCIWPLRPRHYHLVEWLVGSPATADTY